MVNMFLKSKFFLQNILRDEWNWQGTIISDWYGTYTSKKPLKMVWI